MYWNWPECIGKKGFLMKITATDKFENDRKGISTGGHVAGGVIAFSDTYN